ILVYSLLLILFLSHLNVGLDVRVQCKTATFFSFREFRSMNEGLVKDSEEDA
ncbi:hypothetical protein SOVF_176040, partial [Spinacia oleracea]